MDTQGLLLGVVVQAANIQDADGLWDLLKRLKPLYPWLQAVFADSIDNRATALLACFVFGLTLILVRRVAGPTGFVVQPRRWVVERSLGWLGRWRRLSKDYEELPEVSYQRAFALTHCRKRGTTERQGAAECVRAKVRRYQKAWSPWP